MEVTFYGITVSHPSQAARAMLEHKGIAYKAVWVLPGFQSVQLRIHGFRGRTVPAIRVDGRRIQTSRAISRALDELVPEPPLFPADPERAVRVCDAERWGDEVLQPVPRQVFRWVAAHSQEMRTRVAQGAGLPAPAVAAFVNAPVARVLARQADALDPVIRAKIAAVPGLLDHVDELIAEGVIGSEWPNAADFQIGSSVRSLMTFDEFAPAIEGRPAAEMALRLLPEMPGGLPPGYLPAAWTEPLRAG